MASVFSRVGTGGLLALAGGAFLLNVAVDSMFYLASVVMDAATLGAAGYLLWKRDRALKARHKTEVKALRAEAESLSRELAGRETADAILAAKCSTPRTVQVWNGGNH